MAPVRQDSPHRPGLLQPQHVSSPGTPALKPTKPTQPATQSGVLKPSLHDGFEPAKLAKATTPRNGFGATAARDLFQAPGLVAPRQAKVYDTLAPDQRARYDQLVGAARQDPQPAKALKQVQGLLGPDGAFKHYDAISQALQSPSAKTGDRANASADLQHLLFNGKLTQGKTPLTQDALEHLGVLATQNRTATGLDSHALLADTIEDLAHPNRIKQGTGNEDCGGTAASVILAKQKPAEYARIVTDLATKGASRVGNEVWTASPGKEPEGVGTRSLSQRLFAATYVDQTNDPTLQPPTGEQLKGLFRGEYGSEMAKGLRELTGRNYQSAAVPSAKENLIAHRAGVSEALTAVAQHLKAGAPIALNVDQHWMVATGSSGPKGATMIDVADGSGSDKAISVRDLANQIDGFVYDSAISTVPADMRYRRYDKPGTGGDSTSGAQPTGSRWQS